MQTAVTSNYGGDHWRLGFGVNVVVPFFPGKPERIGIELELPFEVDVRGVQMSPKWRVTLGVQKSLYANCSRFCDQASGGFFARGLIVDPRLNIWVGESTCRRVYGLVLRPITLTSYRKGIKM